MIKFSTKQRKVNDLVPFEHNPRQMSKKQVDDLTASLKKFDLAEIPVINTDNTIIAGHQRLRVLQLLNRGEETIDVRIPNKKLNTAEIKEYNIRSNKNTGSWDWDTLFANFDSKALKEWGFTENELSGFYADKDVDIDKIWGGMPEYGDKAAFNAFKTLYVHFETVEDYSKFSELVGQKLTAKTKYMWYPEKPREDVKSMEFTNE